jgi:hypothetical protein
MIREKSKCTFLTIDSRNQKSAQISLKQVIRGKSLCTFFKSAQISGFWITPGHAHQLTSSGWLRWDDLFSCLIPCLFGDMGIEPG